LLLLAAQRMVAAVRRHLGAVGRLHALRAAGDRPAGLHLRAARRGVHRPRAPRGEPLEPGPPGLTRPPVNQTNNVRPARKPPRRPSERETSWTSSLSPRPPRPSPTR